MPELPEWAPPDASDEFASRVVKGIIPKQKATSQPKMRQRLSVDDYVTGVLAGDRSILARAITLIESNTPAHFETAQQVLTRLLPHTGGSLRIGITGIPGAGKSTFIETLGLRLIKQDQQIAVLAIDPTSTISGGSILGDKTRMERLARDPKTFIRPSPSRGTLGGVAYKTRETILVCEAAGFDVIFVETVGTGQSEVTVRSMVDFFLLLLITGSGDELQGIKKGVVELADTIAINKADGDNITRARAARAELSHTLHYLTLATDDWYTRVLTCSSLTGDGILEIWTTIKEFETKTKTSGTFAIRRRDQTREWLRSIIEERLKAYFFANPTVQTMLPTIEQQVMNDELSVTEAAQRLFEALSND